MYAKYQTEALVLGARNISEADKLLALYTKDFGMVRARASAIRSENSKMRYALQNFSRAHIGLVKGIRGWRVAGAVPISNSIGADAHSVKAFARISKLVLRLIKGEDRNDYLYAALTDAHAVLVKKPCEAWATIELMCVARILHALGYLSSEALHLPKPQGQAGPAGTALFSHTAYAGSHVAEAERLREQLLASVNRAIEETHL